MDEESYAIVIDSGSGITKAGLAGEDAPNVVIPTLTGRPGWESFQSRHDAARDFYVGDEAQRKRETLTLSYPMTHGVVTDWEGMEKVWSHVYTELAIAPEQKPVLLSEAPLNPTGNKEKMSEVMFETFRTPGLVVEGKAYLALYASGRHTGVVLHSGDGVSHIVPICESYSFPHAIRRLDLAGRDITSYLQRCLLKKGYSFTTSAEFDIVRDMKEKLCYTALDFDSELLSSSKLSRHLVDKTYELPDGSVVTVGDECFRCTETLFKPSLCGVDSVGVHQLLFNSIKECGRDASRDIYCNIILSGGTTMLPGFTERMQKEISALAPEKARVRVMGYPERKYSVWIGGSILGSLMIFEKIMVTKQEYEEFGFSIVHQKCGVKQFPNL